MENKLKMEDNPSYYQELISKYFAGEASPDEIQLLSVWLSSDIQHQVLFTEQAKTWQAIENIKIENAIDIDAEWNAFSERIAEAPEQKVYSSEKKKEKRFNLFAAIRIAAILIILAVSAFVIYYYSSQPKTEIILAKAQQIENNLPDGTSVTLQTGSTIEYPNKFEGGKRNVKLTGEAYFNVTPDKTKPFVVSVDDIQVEVLGTSFYINSHHGNVEVVLTSGKVAVYKKNKPNEVTFLHPGEKAAYSSKEQTIEKSTNLDPNYMSFKTRRLVFEDNPLKEVVETLNKVYLSDIRIKDNAIAGCRLTATFDNQSIESILNVITATLDLKVNKSGSKYEFVGKGCK